MLQSVADHHNSIDSLYEAKLESMKLLEKTLKNSKAIDRESLCIRSGRLVWLLEIDLKLLAFNGNLIDNVFAATLLTLSNY